MNNPHVYVISGPTAVGKGTVVRALQDLVPELFVSTSATTRPPRPGEIDGVHYYFVSDSVFDELVETDGLLEWARVHNVARYGTPRDSVAEALAEGKNVILEIDLQGARQVRETLPEAIHIFLAPPTWGELLNRLRGRGTETEQQIEQRLATAEFELKQQEEFDHVIVNDELSDTVQQLVDLMGLHPTKKVVS